MITKFKNKIRRLRESRGSSGGYSLVELLVTTIILGTVTLTVCMMMSSGTNMYVGIDKLSSLMYKSQVSATQLKEYFVDCDGLAYDENTKEYYVFDDTKSELNSFKFNATENRLYLTTYTLDNNYIIKNTESQPFATKVSTFAIDVDWFHPAAEENETTTAAGGAVDPEDDESKLAYANSVNLKFTFSLKGSSYDKSQFVSLKNVPIYVENTENLSEDKFIIAFIKAVRGE